MSNHTKQTTLFKETAIVLLCLLGLFNLAIDIVPLTFWIVYVLSFVYVAFSIVYLLSKAPAKTGFLRVNHILFTIAAGILIGKNFIFDRLWSTDAINWLLIAGVILIGMWIMVCYLVQIIKEKGADYIPLYEYGLSFFLFFVLNVGVIVTLFSEVYWKTGVFEYMKGKSSLFIVVYVFIVLYFFTRKSLRTTAPQDESHRLENNDNV